MGDRSFLAGRNFSLADAHAAPMFWYFLETEEGQEMVKAQGALKAWWDSIKERPSVLLACRTAEPS